MYLFQTWYIFYYKFLGQWPSCILVDIVLLQASGNYFDFLDNNLHLKSIMVIR